LVVVVRWTCLIVARGSARIVNCSFQADGRGKESAANGIYNYDGKVTFGCPTGTTGADVPIKSGSELGTSQLPPAKQIVSCH
jgi:hypothetical protein